MDSVDSDLGECLNSGCSIIDLANVLGSGGFVLLDKNHFSGTKIQELGVVVGKSGKVYILNANNLGGYAEGAGQSDIVVQTLQLTNGVWGGCGSYPLEVDTYPLST